MRTKILLTVLVVTLLAACEKDKYQARPQLKFKKVNRNVVARGEIITFTIEVTDAEGDIQDSLFLEKVVPRCSASFFKDKQPMPQFTPTKNLKAEVNITYVLDFNNGQNSILPGPRCPQRNDTATFKFWIKDKEKNISDTAVVENIVLLR